MVTRATIILFFLTFLLIIGIDFLLKDLDYQAVFSDLFDFRNNPGIIYCYLTILGGLIYSIITDIRIKKGHLFKKRID